MGVDLVNPNSTSEPSAERSGITLGADFSGRRVGRYVLVQRVGIGGMGAVYLAKVLVAPDVPRPVAVKIIHPHLAEEERFRAMFLDEARVLARVQHANVGGIVDFGEQAGVAYLVMEWLHGESFGRVLGLARKRGVLEPWLPIRICADAGRGLHAVHEARDENGDLLHVVHRDVSPSNVHVLYDGGVKLIDFGIARSRGRTTEATSTGELKGKLGYMAPEQVQGGAIDRRADVWALGVVLWESVTGRRLFRANNNDAQTLLNVLGGDIPKPSAIVPGLASLDRIALRALARDPDERYSTAAEMADALEEYLHGLGRPAGITQVASWMHEQFGDRRRELDEIMRTAEPERQMLQRALAESSNTPLSVAEPAAIARSAGERPARDRARLAIATVGSVALGVIATLLAVWAGNDRTAADPVPRDPASIESATPSEPTIASSPPAIAAEPPPAAAAESPEPVDAPVASAERSRRARARSERPVETGQLNVVAVPPAHVIWRGRTIGETPLVGHRLPVGEHALIVRWDDGTTRRTRVRIVAGEQARVGPITR